ADRIVLDGPVDPATFGPDLLAPTGPANENALRDWATWAAARAAEYYLGNTRGEVLSTVRRIIAAAASRPLRGGEYSRDGGMVPLILYTGMGDDRDGARADLAGAVRTLVEAADHGSAQPSGWLAENLLGYLTGQFSQYGSVQAAILCGDVPVQSTVEDHWRA